MTSETAVAAYEPVPRRPLIAGDAAAFDTVRRRGSGQETARQMRPRLRYRAGRLLGGDFRVRTCGWTLGGGAGRNIPAGGNMTVVRTVTGAHYEGLETCGSIWICPVCAGKIATARVREVQAIAAEFLKETEGRVYMVTLTIPHHADQGLKPLADELSDAWTRLIRGAPWKRFRDRLGLDGYTRSLEVTHGRHGWHPHLHALLFADLRLSAADVEEARVWLYERWATILARKGMVASPDAFRFEVTRDPNVASAYVVKWGAGAEVVRSESKRARGEGARSPWQLLDDADRGDRDAGRLFREYAKATKGKRHLTWSRHFRDRYGPEADDVDLAAAETEADGRLLDDGETIGRIGVFYGEAWLAIRRHRLTADVLDTAHRGGWPAVLALLRCYSIELSAFETNYRPPQRPPNRPERKNFHKDRADPASWNRHVADIYAPATAARMRRAFWQDQERKGGR